MIVKLIPGSNGLPELDVGASVWGKTGIPLMEPNRVAGQAELRLVQVMGFVASACVSFMTMLLYTFMFGCGGNRTSPCSTDVCEMLKDKLLMHGPSHQQVVSCSASS